MQALIDAATLELPRSLVEIELQRMLQQAQRDLEARGVKLEKLPLNPEALEGQARRRVTLGSSWASWCGRNDLGAKPEQCARAVTEHAQTYEQPFEVVRWVYSEPRRLGIRGFGGRIQRDQLGPLIAPRWRTRRSASMN